MTVTSLARSPWRIAWAERENERRQRAYRDATDAWLRRNDHLVRLRIEAAGFLGCTQPRTGLPVDLDDDELVFRVVPSAELVEAEARHVPGLPTTGPCDFAEVSGEAMPAGLRIVDTGMAVVTSRRVAFAGSERRREWTYADLVGAAHHPDVPVTLLPDHSRLAGLLVPASAVVNFRFYLALAVAAAAGDRAAVTAQADALLAAHQDARPTPLPLVGPEEAPLAAVRPDRRALGAAAVATVVFATIGPGALGPHALGSEQTAPVQRAEIVAMDVLRAGEILAPVRPVGPVAPKVGPGSVGRPTPDLPNGGSSTAAPVRPAASASRPNASAVVAPPVAARVPIATPSVPPTSSASSAPTPGPVPTTGSPTAAPSAPPTATASPTPSSDPALLRLCLDPLQLPLLDPLLCPSPAT